MKLPDMQFNQVAPLQLEGPEVAVAESRQKLALVNQATEGATKIAEVRSEYQLKKTYAEYADHMSKFRREAAKEYAVGKDKIIAWGLDDEIDITGKDVFYRDEWYPLALERVQNQARQEFGQRISSPAARHTFDMEIGTHNAEVLTRETEQAYKDAEAEHEAQVMADIDTYAARGDYDSAFMAIGSSMHMTPSEKQVASQKVIAMKDENTVRDEIQALSAHGDVNGLKEYANYLRGKDTGQTLSLDQEKLDTWAGRADATAKGIADDAKVSAEQNKSAVRAQSLNFLFQKQHDGTLTYEDVLAVTSNPLADSSTVSAAFRIHDNFVESKGETGYLKHRDVKPYNETMALLNDPTVPAYEVQKLFEKNAGKYTQTDSDSISKAIQAKGKPVGVTREKVMSQLNAKLQSIGITQKLQPEKYSAAIAWADMELNAATTGDRVMDDKAAIKLVDDIYIDAGKRPKGGFEIDRPGSVYDAEGDDIWDAIKEEDEDLIPDILYLLTTTGKTPTKANIERAYKDILEDNNK